MPDMINRGQLVEFTHGNKTHFGVCAKTGILGTEIEIETTGGMYKSWHILSYGWTGWLPEELIQIWEKYNPTSPDELD